MIDHGCRLLLCAIPTVTPKVAYIWTSTMDTATMIWAIDFPYVVDVNAKPEKKKKQYSSSYPFLDLYISLVETTRSI
jgi:hypothetical protein